MSVQSSRIIAVALDERHSTKTASQAMAFAIDLAHRAEASILAVRIRVAVGRSPQANNALDAYLAQAASTLRGSVTVRAVDEEVRPGGDDCTEEAAAAVHAAGEAFVATAAGFGAGILVTASSRTQEPLDGLVGAIVAAADVPTVIVPPDVQPVGDYPFHLVVALDGVPRNGHVAVQMSELHNWFHSTISLLHVLHPGGGRVRGLPLLAHDRAAQMLQRSAACLGARGVAPSQVHVVVRSGQTSRVIVDHLRREHATLGVLPVVTREPGHRRPHGVTNAVLATSHVPIVLFQASAYS